MCPRRRAGPSVEVARICCVPRNDRWPRCQLADWLCLVFDALGYHKTYKDCCVHKKCSLLDRRETRHSGAARGNASYSASYFSDDVLLAALYEGNSLDCALYAAAAERLGS